MKRVAALVLLACCAFAADKPRVTRESLEVVERNVDKAIRALDTNDPYDLLGFTRGVYLPGYGVVFSAEVNLVITPITPFHSALTAPQVAKLREKKLTRLVFVRELMRQVLVATASALDNVPLNEQVVFGLTLFYRSFENREGLPGQIVMYAPRQVLADFKANRINRAQLEAAIQVQEL